MKKALTLFRAYLPTIFRTTNTRKARPKPPPNSQTRKAGPAAAKTGENATIMGVIDF